GDAASANPWIAGGAVSTVGDMRRFLAMVLGDGRIDGRRIVSTAALEEMARDQTRGTSILRSPFDDGRGYGLGVWIDRIAPDGSSARIASHGGAGSIPWIDRRLGYAAHLFVHEPDLEELRGFRGALALSEELEPVIEGILLAAQERGEIPASSVAASALGSRP